MVWPYWTVVICWLVTAVCLAVTLMRLYQCTRVIVMLTQVVEQQNKFIQDWSERGGKV